MGIAGWTGWDCVMHEAYNTMLDVISGKLSTESTPKYVLTPDLTFEIKAFNLPSGERKVKAQLRERTNTHWAILSMSQTELAGLVACKDSISAYLKL